MFIIHIHTSILYCYLIFTLFITTFEGVCQNGIQYFLEEAGILVLTCGTVGAIESQVSAASGTITETVSSNDSGLIVSRQL